MDNFSASTHGHTDGANHQFHGAAIIDAEGREIPITEDMIQQAFNKLISASNEID